MTNIYKYVFINKSDFLHVTFSKYLHKKSYKYHTFKKYRSKYDDYHRILVIIKSSVYIENVTFLYKIIPFFVFHCEKCFPI